MKSFPRFDLFLLTFSPSFQADGEDAGPSKAELAEAEESLLPKNLGVGTSLLLQHSKLKKLAEARQESAMEKQLKEEERILAQVREQTALKGAAELAKGIQYTEPLTTGWKPPQYILNLPQKRHERVRRRKNILVEGNNPPPPLKTFTDMKLPRGFLNGLSEKVNNCSFF